MIKTSDKYKQNMLNNGREQVAPGQDSRVRSETAQKEIVLIIFGKILLFNN